MTATTAIQADKDRGTLTASTDKFSLKSGVDSQGREREFIEGFLATTHLDKGNDEFTVDALKSMAEDINTGSESIDAVFNEIDEQDFKEDVEEANVGNVEHMNNPAFPFADTRTVPAFRTTKAEVREMQDGEKGLWVKGMLNSDGLPGDTISAIKNSIKDGFLKAFSVEFKAKKVRRVQKKNRVVRIIEDAVAKGAALTGRPMNPAATMTDAMLKSMATEYKVEYAFEIGDKVSWNDTSGTVRDRTKDSCFNDEIDGDFEVCGTQEDPAYLIEVDNEEETMVAHKQSLFTEGKHGYKAELSEEERTPPEAAQKNAEMALNAREDTGNPNDCGTSTGWKRAEQLADGGALPMNAISKMSQFARHEDNSEMDDEEGRSDCGWMMWKAWGGDEGIEWAQRQMDKVQQGKNMQIKQEYTIQTPDYSATSKGKWESPNKSDFPDDYDVMSIFIARNSESDNFTDQKLPVVDWRNNEATLVLEALRSAHELAEQVEGITDEEASRAKEVAANLAEKEFDVKLGESTDSEESKNDINTMTDGEQPEDEPEVEETEGKSEGETQETGDSGLKEQVAEIKSDMEQLKETNESLREENEELKSELEDLKTVQEIKSELDEVKSLFEDVELEDGARVPEQETKSRDVESGEDEKAEWKSAIDRLPDGYLKTEGKSMNKMEAFAKNHGVSTEEVKNYVNRD